MTARITHPFCGMLAVVLAALPATAPAQSYLSIELTGPMTPDIKAEIAKVVAPSAAAAEAIGELAHAAERAITVEEFCRQIKCDGRVLAATGISVNDLAAGALPSDIKEEVERLAEGRSSDRFALPSQVVVPSLRLPGRSASGGFEEYLIIKSGNDFHQANGGAFAQAGIGNAAPAIVPVPVEAGALAPAAVQSHGPNGPAVGAVLFDDQSTKEIAAIERDIETFGATSRTIPIAADATHDDLDKLKELLFLSSGSATTVDTPRPDADIMWPIRQTSQSATGGSCRRQHKRWPFDVTRIKEVLAFDLEVLAAMGQLHPRRSNILIVDSGIASSLIRKPELRPFLYADTPKLVNYGRYYKGTNILELECDHSDGHPNDISIGYVPEAEIENEKTCARPDKSFNPLTPPSHGVGSDPDYMPEHGGYVGGIAAGGPELIASGWTLTASLVSASRASCGLNRPAMRWI